MARGHVFLSLTIGEITWRSKSQWLSPVSFIIFVCFVHGGFDLCSIGFKRDTFCFKIVWFYVCFILGIAAPVILAVCVLVCFQVSL